jgi:tetratricopeptide (TPR) repeat protein
VSAQRISESHPRERLDRKALKGPDEFVVWTTRAATWAQQHRNLVLTAGGVAAAGFLVAGLFAWQASRRADAAAEAFHHASVRFTAGQYGDAATQFDTLARDYPGTPFGRLALLYRGHSLARQNQPADAAVAYQEFLANAPDADYLRQLALTGLARSREQTGDAAGARESFERAAELEGPYRVDALLSLARLAEASGDGAAAEAAYRKALDADLDPETRAFVTKKVPATEPQAAAAIP